MLGGNGTLFITCPAKPHSEARCRQHHTVGVKDSWMVRDIYDENQFHRAKDLRLGRSLTVQHDNEPKPKEKTTQVWLRDNFENVQELPRQSQDLNIFQLWGNLKMSVYEQSPFSLTSQELQQQMSECPFFMVQKLLSIIQKNSNLELWQKCFS